MMSAARASLVRRLVIATLAAGLAAAVVGVSVIQVLERDRLLEEAEERNLVRAERTAALVDDRLASTTSKLALLTTRASVNAMHLRAGEELRVALRAAPELDELHLYGADGAPAAAAASTRLVRPEDLPARPDLVDALPVSDIHAPPGEAPWLEVAVAVEDPPGTTVGILVGRMPVMLVTREAQLPDEGELLALAAADGRMLDHPEFERVLDAERYPIEVLHDEPHATTVPSGPPRLIATSPLRSIPAWVVVEQDRGAVLQPAQGVLGAFTVVVLVVVTAIVSAVIWVGRRLLRPLTPLAQAVERLREGDLAARVDAHGAGELTLLGEGFNRMADALQERQLDLERAERDAREAGERLRVMVEGVADHAIVLLGPGGEVRSWNTGARRLLGVDEHEALGQPLAHFFDRDEAPAQPLSALDVDGRARVEGWCRRGAAGRFWAEIAVTALQDEAGDPYGFAVIVHDQTERRRAAQAVAEALAQEQHAAAELRRTAQLKDEFLAITAHELRTPLSGIVGATQLLSQGWDELVEDDRQRYHGMIAAFADDMRGIVERLLEFSRLQAGRMRVAPEPVQLRDACARHLQLVGTETREHRLEVAVPDETVLIDPAFLRHVLTNLVSNAARFSAPGTRIGVTVRTEPAGQLTLEVVDEGVGIPADDIDAIFELFRQSRRTGSATRGTGVGLAIVKRYAELLGGEVSVDSRPGQGSRFAVTVPLGVTSGPDD